MIPINPPDPALRERACAFCDHRFVAGECAVLYEEGDTPVLVFCPSCAGLLTLPPNTRLSLTVMYAELDPQF